MSIKNYGELKTEVASWLNRTDTEVVSRIPDFIRLAESEIYDGLECRDNEFSVAYTQDDNPKNPIELPENFRSFKMVTFNDEPLDRVSDVYLQAILQGQDGALPHSYTTLERQLWIAPWTTEDIDPADGEFELVVHYYGSESLGEMAFFDTPTNPNFRPESDGTPADFNERSDASTTRLFLINPHLYVAGACYWAFSYLQDDKHEAKWEKIYARALGRLRTASKRARRAGSTPKVRGAYEAPDSRRYYNSR